MRTRTHKYFSEGVKQSVVKTNELAHQSTSQQANQPASQLTDRLTNKCIKIRSETDQDNIEQEVVNKTECHTWPDPNKFSKTILS